MFTNIKVSVMILLFWIFYEAFSNGRNSANGEFCFDGKNEGELNLNWWFVLVKLITIIYDHRLSKLVRNRKNTTMPFYNGTPKCCMLVVSQKYQYAIISKVIYVTPISWFPRILCRGKRKLYKRQWNNFEP